MTERAPAEFLDLSVTLTGYDAVDLQGTGMIDTYWNTLGESVGDAIRSRLIEAWRRAEVSAGPLEAAVQREIMDDATLGPVARNLITLWYLGQWDAMPVDWWADHGGSGDNETRIPSSEAYVEGLVWDAIGAHPQGAKQQGFGTWHFPPGTMSPRRTT